MPAIAIRSVGMFSATIRPLYIGSVSDYHDVGGVLTLSGFKEICTVDHEKGYPSAPFGSLRNSNFLAIAYSWELDEIDSRSNGSMRPSSMYFFTHSASAEHMSNCDPVCLT